MPKDELPFDAIDAGRVPAASNTATGVAVRDRNGENPEENDDDQVLGFRKLLRDRVRLSAFNDFFIGADIVGAHAVGSPKQTELARISG